MSSPLEVVLERLKKARKSGKGWLACCPAHDDQNPSLSIDVGDEGQVLVYCHAGCGLAEVCAALGLEVKDLFLPGVDQTDWSSKAPRPARASSGQPSLDGAAQAMLGAFNKSGSRWELNSTWIYRNAVGEEVMAVVRLDEKGTGKKSYRPFHKVGDQWEVGKAKAPSPLYRLNEIGGVEEIYVVEGEKAADAAARLGLPATTSAFGSGAAKKTDWSPIANSRIVIVPDADEPGAAYAKDVANLIRAINPHASIRILELPGLETKGDLVDFIEARRREGHDDSRIALEVRELARSVVALPITSPLVGALNRSTQRRLRPYVPFPVDALPSPLRELVVEGAIALGCPPAMIAMPALATLASCIGTSRRMKLKETWLEPCMLWTAIVSESGTRKSPAIDLAVGPLKRLQEERMVQYQEAKQEYAILMEDYDQELAEWKEAGRQGAPPERPEKPRLARLVVSDTTFEALAEVLREAPRGVLMQRDELAAWFKSFDAYKPSDGGDAAKWIELYGARTLIVDRKTKMKEPILLPEAAACVTGGIQPGILSRILGKQHMESGLGARLLMAWPPRRTKQWTDETVRQEVLDAYDKLIRGLCDLQPGEDRDGKRQAIAYPFTPSARHSWIRFYNAHAEETAKRTGNDAAAWSKLEAAPARIGLVFHCIRFVMMDASLEAEDEVDKASLNAAILLTEWFCNETERIYQALGEAEQRAELREVVDLISERRGVMTPRELRAAKSKYRPKGVIDTLLNELVQSGDLQRVHGAPGPDGGRPSVGYALVGWEDEGALRSETAQPAREAEFQYGYGEGREAVPALGFGASPIDLSLSLPLADLAGIVGAVSVSKPQAGLLPMGLVTGRGVGLRFAVFAGTQGGVQ